MKSYQERFEKLAAEVESWRAETGVPGVTFGVRVDGQSYTAGAGVTNVEHPLPVTDETLFQIGSVTKTVTATAIMRLVEQGKLDLDARVRDYLPDFRVVDEVATGQVKLRQLLTHVGGWWGDVFTDTGIGDDAAEKYVQGMAEFEQLAPLGTVFSYNNAAFCVAGRVIEVVTETTFEQAIHDLIFEPLGMQDSYFFPHQAMLQRFAVGHQEATDDEQVKVLSPWAIPRGMNAAGGISCHIQDLLRYGNYHLGTGPPLLGTASLKELHRPQVPINSYMGSVGLAWFMNEFAGTKLIWHNGGTNGQNSVLTLVPEKGLALGMMTNGNSGGKVSDRFNKRVLRDFCGIEIPEPQVIESSQEELAQYAGLYRGVMRKIALRMDAGKLFMDIGMLGVWPANASASDLPEAEVALCGPDQLLVLDGEYKNTRVDLIRDDLGEVRYLRFGSRINVRQ